VDHLNFARRRTGYCSLVECGGLEYARRYFSIDQVRGSSRSTRWHPVVAWQRCDRARGYVSDCWRYDIDFADEIACSAGPGIRGSHR
jgi:hypothetical protein